MNPSSIFIHRPVATTLLTIAIALAGAVAYTGLPVSPLPQVDFPTISVNASLPGATPEIVASSIATPLERQFSRIAGVSEMTSASAVGATTITLQFDLSRDIEGAARDVEAAINAARTYLPANLPTKPTYRKVNPADAPIMIIGLTSDQYGPRTLYDLASTVIQQRLSQIRGVGQVNVGGGALPSVRVNVNPTQLNSFGLTLGDIRTALGAQNSDRPRGQLANDTVAADILANGQISRAEEYKPLIIGYHAGAAVRLDDVAEVTDDVENIRAAGYLNGQRAVLLIIFRQPGANIIETVDRIRTTLPYIAATIPRGINSTIVLDRTTTIRASVREVERSLSFSVVLVIVVVFVFLRRARATLIPGIAVPVSLIGTFAAMHLFGYSLDNLSLMALTISTGFVVDDAIVVMENITRHLEAGMAPLAAALQGAREIGFTVLSISISLIAVFIPILLMGGIVGRLFREFAVTLSTAIVISMVVSLTTTPMMCAYLLRHDDGHRRSRISNAAEQVFQKAVEFYERSLTWVLAHPGPVLAALLATIAVNIALIIEMPKGFFPLQDTGVIAGGLQGPQDASFAVMQDSVQKIVTAIKADPAIQNVVGFTGGQGASNGGFIFAALKPLDERRISAMQVIARLRPTLNSLPVASAFLQPTQDLRIGGRASNALYQYTIRSDTVDDLVTWGPRLLTEMRRLHGLQDINSDQLHGGLEAFLTYDRATAARLGLTPQTINSTLYAAFGQSLASVIYTPLNQYFVVLEVAPRYSQDPQALRNIYFHAANRGASGGAVPLSTVATNRPGATALAVNHDGLFPSTTVSFNLNPGLSLSQATALVEEMRTRLNVPATVRGFFSGTLRAYQQSLRSEPWLVVMALLAVYIVLGMLYESLAHPLTIISTLPSASVGAMLALLLFRMDLNVISIIGIVLLIGIVKKNAIMMIDFALVAERDHHKTTRDAIFEACLLRFRPILMTTMAALVGALPLAFGTGTGSELRRPLGITIVGGLIVSQMLTLYTTPVVYLYLDRLRLSLRRQKDGVR
ncbi:MAG TPA: efflux RND transporter permease subunit [Vicinamibacterales bacterium]|nr:efflux RND transporter permease subunit [Vicinamibacterales bacterium]